MRKLQFTLWILVGLLLLPYSLKAAGLAAFQNSLFADIKAHAVGDLLTIDIFEDAQASNLTQTTGEKNGKFDLTGGPGVGPLDFIPLFGASTENKNTFDGKGSQARRGNLKARMTARVVAVRPNGDLVIEGTRVLGINGDKEMLTLTGVVRSQDVGANNVVASYSIADAQIGYQGKGPGATAARPGIIMRFLNWLF